MTTLEPWPAGGIRPDVANHSTTTAVLNAGIETLTALKGIVETTPVEAVFESATVILTLVRVGFLVLFPFLHSLTGGTIRTG